MMPYNVQLVQELEPIDHSMRFLCAKWACERVTEDADFGKKKIIFSDEAHFNLGGYVNKQNCRKFLFTKIKEENIGNIWF